MKKNLFSLACSLSLIGSAQTSPSFTVGYIQNINTISCLHSSVTCYGSPASLGTYVWTGPGSSQMGPTATFTAPGTYTVVGTDSSNVSSTQTFVILSNTLAPGSSITPTFATITCTTSSQISFTANTSSSNCTHKFLSPYGGTVFSQNATELYSPVGPGVYTLVTTDNTNGCSNTKQFTITSSNGYPTYSVVSPQNFTLGCASKSFAIISIVNAQTTPTPGGAISYTLLPPGSTGYLPAPPNTFTATIPGTWTVVVKDNFNGCETKTPISIVQNTASPTLTVIVPKQVLDCSSTQTNLKAHSSTPNTSSIWYYPGTPGMQNGDSINVYANLSAPSASFIANYTITITDNSNLCNTSSVIPMYQSLYKPNAAISSGGNFTLTCLTPTIMLTNTSSTGIPPSTGFPTNQPVIGLLWTGPAPLSPAANSSTYIASVAGIYTLQAKDLNNKCTSTATINIVDDCNKVGIEKNGSNNLAFNVFPNPNNGLITLKTEKVPENSYVKIYNMLGVLVKKDDLNANQKTIDIQNESSGVYIIQIIENDIVIYSSKFVKQ